MYTLRYASFTKKLWYVERDSLYLHRDGEFHHMTCKAKTRILVGDSDTNDVLKPKLFPAYFKTMNGALKNFRKYYPGKDILLKG